MRALSPPLGAEALPALTDAIPVTKTHPAGAVAVTESPSAIGDPSLKVHAITEVSGAPATPERRSDALPARPFVGEWISGASRHDQRVEEVRGGTCAGRREVRRDIEQGAGRVLRRDGRELEGGPGGRGEARRAPAGDGGDTGEPVRARTRHEGDLRAVGAPRD